MLRGASTPVGARDARRSQRTLNAFRPGSRASSGSMGQPGARLHASLPVPTPVPAVSAQGTQPTLFTLGYAGVRLETLLRALVEHQISVVIDCRWDTNSSQPEFYGATLRRAVECRGMGYRHLAALGSAPNLRYRLREEGDWDAFAAAYLAALVSQEEVLRRIADWAQSHPVCLLSCERDASLSHRGLLASHLAELAGLQIHHVILW